MNHYELLITFPGKLSETEVPQSEQTLRALLQTAGFSVTREESLGKRKLAYDIKGEQYGYYHVLEGDAEPTAMAEVDKRLRLAPEILRHAAYIKAIKSQEVRERETKLRERVAHARATKAAAATARATATSVTPATPAVDVAALDKKLEELLETPSAV